MSTPHNPLGVLFNMDNMPRVSSEENGTISPHHGFPQSMPNYQTSSSSQKDAEQMINRLQIVEERNRYIETRNQFLENKLAEVTQITCNLQSQVQNLKHINALREPLVNAGVATRCRFMEYAKDVKIPSQGARDLEIVKNGNRAAHHGNVEADAAMYVLGYRPMNHTGQDGTSSLDVFEHLYGIEPLGVGNIRSPAAIEIMNMKATMLSVKVARWRSPEPAYARFLEIMGEVEYLQNGFRVPEVLWKLQTLLAEAREMVATVMKKHDGQKFFGSANVQERK